MSGSSGEVLRLAAEKRLGELIHDKYLLRRVLGVGGMGAVYQAHHRFTERDVALKLLHPQFAKNAHFAHRFSAEMKAAAAIDHPGIADVLDGGPTAEGELYVVFELLQGMDLGRAIARKRVTVEIILTAGLQVLDALAVAHERGFVHRDIKPANIFLTRTAEDLLEVKLLDFGIARRIETGSAERLTEAGAVLGTPYYMSPEQMAGEEVDGRADLWALGVVLYFALSGELPFQARSYAALLAEMLSRGAASLGARRPDLPAALVGVVDRALSRETERRFCTAQEMASALRATDAFDFDLLHRQTMSHTPLATEIVRPDPAPPPRPAGGPRPPQPEEPRPEVFDVLDQIETETRRLEQKRATDAKESDDAPEAGLLGGLFSRKKKKR